MRKYNVLLRRTSHWRKKKFNYYVPPPIGMIVVDPIMIYFPLIEEFKL